MDRDLNKINLKKLPVLKKTDKSTERKLNSVLIKENRLGLRYLEEK